MLSFVFNGKDSYKDYGILIGKRPELPSPKRRVSYINVPGRNSSLRYDEETYEDITIAVECSFKGNPYQRIDEIKSWLIGSGERDLVFSYQSDKKYIAQVVNSIDFGIVLKVTSKFVILFNCRPFKYSVSNSLFTVSTSGTTLMNSGSIGSDPIISVFGNGNISLKINSQELQLKEIEGKIILNSVLQDAYDDSLNNLNSKISGEFLRLNIGENLISWTGNVAGLEVIPNWRWL